MGGQASQYPRTVGRVAIDPDLEARIWREAREHAAAAPRLTPEDERRLKAILAPLGTRHEAFLPRREGEEAAD